MVALKFSMSYIFPPGLFLSEALLIKLKSPIMRQSISSGMSIP
jgi:hypothetical protein